MNPASIGTVVIAAYVISPLLALAVFGRAITVLAEGRIALLVSAAAGTVAFVLFCVAAAVGARRRARPATRPGEVEREVNYIVASGAAVVLAIALLISPYGWQWAVAYAGIALVYIAIWVPPAMRRIGFRTSIVAGCTRNEAFALVSDPRNWHRYFPNLQVFEPIQLPLKVGDLIHDRVDAGSLVLEAWEQVVAAEPGRRFGTAVTPNKRKSSGVYELNDVPGGTEIAYVYDATLMLGEAILGSGPARSSLVGKLLAQREASLQRIKQLLEGQPAAL